MNENNINNVNTINNENNSSNNNNQMQQQPMGSVECPTVASYQYVPPVAKKESPMLMAIRENFSFYAMATLIYSVWFTLCLYKNSTGITAPFFTLGTLCYCFVCIRKLGVPIKKDIIFYAAGIMLLGINLCTTLDPFLVFFDYTGTILLVISGMLHLFYQDKDWGLGQYIASIFNIIFGSIGRLFRVFSDLSYYNKVNKKKDNKIKYVFIGIICALPILFIVIILLASADGVFNAMIGDNLSFLDNAGNIFRVLLMMVFAYLGAYAVIACFAAYEITVNKTKKEKYEPIIAITINVLLALVYLLFSSIQIIYLFMGKMQLPDDLTYAEYAREGFFQLLMVCIINLILVLISLYYFKESKVLKGVLTVISGCTYIMIASSALRMYMYVQAYSLSYLRILVFFSLAILTLLMTGIVIYSFQPKFPLFRYSTVVVTICYLALAFAHPDYLIAEYNLRPGQNEDRIDYRYVRNLSTDAAPAIIECLKENRYPGIFESSEDVQNLNLNRDYGYEDNSILKYNFSGEMYYELYHYYDN